MKNAPPVCTVLNLKGGVGKTHVFWLLAGACQERCQKCLVVDLDRQANLTQSFLPEHRDPVGVELIFEPTADVESASLIHRTRFDCIDVVPATGHFARYDLAQPEQWERERLHVVLGETLAEISTDYDLVLLNCPPRISLASYAALCASNVALVPLEAADWGGSRHRDRASRDREGAAVRQPGPRPARLRRLQVQDPTRLPEDLPP